MALKCPRCTDVDLDEIELDEVLIDRCPRCAGLWFDNSELGEITGMRPKLKKLESFVPASEHSDDNMPCPRCDGVLLRHVTTEEQTRRHALLRCASCMGTWMDRGELRTLEDKHLIDTLKAYAKELL